jgi:flagellar protein FlaG
MKETPKQNEKDTKENLHEGERKVKDAVKKLNQYLKNENIHAVYEMHDKFKNDVMIKIIDSKTKEVLMEIPPKKLIDMIANMCESMGIILDKKA